MQEKLRIILSGAAPWVCSGYGQQIRQFYPLIANDGYSCAHVAFHGLVGGKVKIGDIQYYPKINDTYGNDAMLHYANEFNADVLLTLQDVWVIKDGTIEGIKKMNHKWIPIVPIDQEPVSPVIQYKLEKADSIITMSKYGHSELLRNNMKSTYIPHTVETKVFKKMDKKKARKALGLPEDAFVFGMVAVNYERPSRKSFQEVLEAFKVFHAKHKDALLYFHTDIGDPLGFPIRDFVNYLGLSDAVYCSPKDWCKIDMGVDYREMPKIYSAFDVLLSPSSSEGFGVPIIEALACEVPVIVNDFTAMKDLIDDGVDGYKTKVGVKKYTMLRSYIGFPDTYDLYEKMEAIFNSDTNKMGENGRRKVINEYDLEVVYKKHWRPFLESLQKSK